MGGFPSPRGYLSLLDSVYSKLSQQNQQLAGVVGEIYLIFPAFFPAAGKNLSFRSDFRQQSKYVI
jgi:hypothetical protein